MLSGVWSKIERAESHISQLERLVRAFHEANIHRIIREEDAQAGKWRLVYRGDPPKVPTGIPLTIGDAAHNLRSALDHFAYAVVTPGQLRPDKVQFPIWRLPVPPNTARQWKNEVERQLRTPSHALWTTLLALEPYEGGNSEYLWTLDRLDIIDKHRTLLASGFGHGLVIDIGQFMPRVEWMEKVSIPIMPNPADMLIPADKEPLNDGLIFYEAPLEEEHEAQVTLFIALDEPVTLYWKDIVPAIRSLADEVKGLLERLGALI